MDPGGGVDAGHGNFEEGEEGVHGVLRGVGPDVVGGLEAAEEDAPVDDGDEEGVGGDGGIVEVVEGL